MYQSTRKELIAKHISARNQQLVKDANAMIEQLHDQKKIVEQMLYDKASNHNAWHTPKQREQLSTLYSNILSSLVTWTAFKG